MRSIPITFHHKTIQVAVSTTAGSGIPIVCLHGLQSCSEVFTPIVTSCTNANRPTCCIDFIGFGASEKPEDFSYDLADQASCVLQALSILDIRECIVVGHSMGGMVGTLLLQSQLHIRKFVSMEGNLRYEDCGDSVRLTGTVSFVDFAKRVYPDFVAKIVSSEIPQDFRRGQWLRKIPSYAFYHSAQSIIAWSRSEKLLEIFSASKIPRLLVVGDKNSHMTKVLSPDVEVAVIPNAGHRMLADNESATIDAIEKFVLRK